MEVWNTNFSFLPPFSRMPSEPLLQPAASKTWAALSGLNSNFVLGDTKRFGLFRKLDVAMPVRP